MDVMYDMICQMIEEKIMNESECIIYRIICNYKQMYKSVSNKTLVSVDMKIFACFFY